MVKHIISITNLYYKYAMIVNVIKFWS